MASSGAIPKMLKKIRSRSNSKGRETFEDDENFFYDLSGLETLGAGLAGDERGNLGVAIENNEKQGGAQGNVQGSEAVFHFKNILDEFNEKEVNGTVISTLLEKLFDEKLKPILAPLRTAQAD